MGKKQDNSSQAIAKKLAIFAVSFYLVYYIVSMGCMCKSPQRQLALAGMPCTSASTCWQWPVHEWHAHSMHCKPVHVTADSVIPCTCEHHSYVPCCTAALHHPRWWLPCRMDRTRTIPLSDSPG